MTATRDIHGASMMSYLIYMAIRVMEMRMLLKPDGFHLSPLRSDSEPLSETADGLGFREGEF